MEQSRQAIFNVSGDSDDSPSVADETTNATSESSVEDIKVQSSDDQEPKAADQGNAVETSYGSSKQPEIKHEVCENKDVSDNEVEDEEPENVILSAADDNKVFAQEKSDEEDAKETNVLDYKVTR